MNFYRIALTDPATLYDFTSDEALGIPAIDDDPERLRLRRGISVYATESQARRKAVDYPHLGRYIAVLSIPDQGAIPFERTTRSRGHHTLWGDPTEIMSHVVAVKMVWS
jgi:hypothetical protein